MDDLGADSLDIVELGLAIEEKFEMHFLDSVTEKFQGPTANPEADTVRDLIGATFIMLENPDLEDAGKILDLAQQLPASITGAAAEPPAPREKRCQRPTGLFGLGLGVRKHQAAGIRGFGLIPHFR